MNHFRVPSNGATILLPRLPDILLAVRVDTNPKRKRGTQLLPSLTLRVSAERLIIDREKYKSNKTFTNYADFTDSSKHLPRHISHIRQPWR